MGISFCQNPASNDPSYTVLFYQFIAPLFPCGQRRAMPTLPPKTCGAISIEPSRSTTVVSSRLAV
jgi:hypothetical protein